MAGRERDGDVDDIVHVGITRVEPFAPESEERADSFRRALRRSKGFSLHVVVADGAARREILRRLRAWSGSGGIPTLYFFAEGEAGVAQVERWLAEAWDKEPVEGAVLSDGNALVANGKALSALNVARDRLGELIRGPCVMVVSPQSEGEMARLVPDLFDVRAGTWEFQTAPASDRALERSTEFFRDENWPDVPRADLQIWAASLRALKNEKDPPPPGALANAWLKLGGSFLKLHERSEAMASADEAEHYAKSAGYTAGVGAALVLKARSMMELGRNKDAEELLRDALDRFRQAGDVRMQMAALHNLVRALHFAGRTEDARAALETELQLCRDIQDEDAYASACGSKALILVDEENLDEALRIYREECLPFYKKRGDNYNIARISLEIAGIFAQRGQIDEALRICQDEALPVFEKRADIYSSAATWSRIADLLQLSGKFDESLQIRYQKVLPIFTTLGYTRERAITWSRIADIAEKQKNPGDAIRILIEEVLPTFENLAEARVLFLMRVKLVRLYATRNEPGDRERAAELLRHALEAAERSHVPELQLFKDAVSAIGTDESIQ